MRETFDKRELLPVHPWSDRLDELPKGKGNFYFFGPNYTVDPIVLSSTDTPEILLIQRADTGQWALPGGFVDEGEDAITAGLRELKEETALGIPDATPTVIYSGPVDDPRSTQHAWPETTALLWRIKNRPEVTAGDDAAMAQWVPLNNLPATMYGSHAKLIQQAIEDHGSLKEKLAYASETEPASAGGHMGYDRQIVTFPTGRVFVKRHAADRFSDATREAHSRQYLEKEHSVYRQLSPQMTHTPTTFELIGDHTLAMDAYEMNDGWHWRAPRDAALQKRYIQEVIDALQDIEGAQFDDSSRITPTHITVRQEGWDKYQSFEAEIRHKLASFSSPAATMLLDQLNSLYESYRQAPLPRLESFTHGDLRQSNLAWHPEHGVKIIDWSWAGPGLHHADTTSFLIDLAKSGVDISDYRQFFNHYHATQLIGFWLYHSTWATYDGDDTVRTHQATSAISAFELLQRFSEER